MTKEIYGVYYPLFLTVVGKGWGNQLYWVIYFILFRVGLKTVDTQRIRKAVVDLRIMSDI